ncbi:hypothetical protein FGO68_gene17403 [Halteria grandinella]|uniref:Uncharacterized protein n=1 Tax=Halteria grandinella TaxID=5974 RepID=A0A8J8SXN9_HALGN|nr:hypothetical protein FGO68_gene17403 [Halteria grandinella]
MSEYVEIHQANLGEELDIYTQKIREGKKVYGVQTQPPPKRDIEIQQPLSWKQNQQSVKSIYDQPYLTNTSNTYKQYQPHCNILEWVRIQKTMKQDYSKIMRN